MNFNYSYRAFLISSLLVGNLILILGGVSAVLNNYEVEEEESYNLEYSDVDIEELEELVELTPIKSRIETHKAYNEAEKYIADSQEELSKLSEATEAKLAEMNQALENNKDLGMNSTSTISPEEIIPESSKNDEVVGGANRRSTNSYKLEGRNALYFPNPVYTCEGFGTVVIDIEVSNTGKVSKAQFNEQLSSTQNLCLVDNALDYAKRSRFTTDASRDKQQGTITYLFPGQN